MRPHVLVGIEVGRVAGQEVEAQPSAVRVHEAGRRHRDVRRMAVENQVDLAAQLTQQGVRKPTKRGALSVPR